MQIRNIAIIAHVDHGKTTLVDTLLQQSGTLSNKDQNATRIMDSSDQEKERGITITSKNTSIKWKDFTINIVDTPGHADFGGEVERVLSMVDSVCLLVDAVDGPMPQTRFVTQKAFNYNLSPIVVINKIDRDGARPDWVLDQIFDLFDKLGATDKQLDFPVIYTSAIMGVSGLEHTEMTGDMETLFQAIVDNTPQPKVCLEGEFQMQISALDYDSFIGVIGIGRITRGSIENNTQVKIISSEKQVRSGKVLSILKYHGLNKLKADSAQAGDIVCITGIAPLSISDTICHPDKVEALPALAVDEPTVSVTFQVNDSPFAGKDGKFITSRKIKERLEAELIHNVALRVEQGSSADKFKVSGRGELHLAVLIESMRREGYELGISRPEVIQKTINGEIHEPFETVLIDIEQTHQGAIIEEMAQRGASMNNMEIISDRVKIDFIIPSRGLIGFRSQFLTMTAGTGIMNTLFDHFGPVKKQPPKQRNNGALISMTNGKALGYALFNLQDRGKLCIEANTEVYEGMIIGIHSRDNDLVVNPIKGKQLTNIRAAGSDENINLVPPIKFNLEQSMDFINDDELVEVTPNTIRLRKKHLTENLRKRASKNN
jgi:GTP-binding protein